MSQTQTKPGQQHFDELSAEQLSIEIPEGTVLTAGTGRMDFESVKDLISDRPLRGIQQSNEDYDDARAAREALEDPERISHEEVRRELEME